MPFLFSEAALNKTDNPADILIPQVQQKARGVDSHTLAQPLQVYRLKGALGEFDDEYKQLERMFLIYLMTGNLKEAAARTGYSLSNSPSKFS
jgi:hypothetical protein